MRKAVVVLGAGVGGLSAAIHARLKGHDVLVLEQREVPGGKAASISTHGFRLDRGPSIIILPEVYEAVFKAAGRKMSDYLQFVRLDPITRVFFEGQEAIDLPGDRQGCERLVSSFGAKDGENFKAMFERFDKIVPLVHETIFDHPIDQWWQFASPKFIKMGLGMSLQGNYRQQIDKWFESPLLRAFFYGFPSYSGQSLDGTGAGALFIPYFMIAGGVFYPVGGVGQIPSALYKLATELGVEFRFNTKVTGLNVTNGQVKSATLESGEQVEFQTLISNLDRTTVQGMLGTPSSNAPSFSYFTLHYGLPRTFPDLKHHSLFIPKNYVQSFEDLYDARNFPGEPIVYVNETTELDPEGAPPGTSNFFAVVTCPAEEQHLDWKTLQSKAKDQTRSVLEKIGIDLSEPIFERVQTPMTFRERDGNYRGSLYGEDEKHRPFKGMLPHPNRDPKIKNLIYCGGSVQPGAGLPMVTLSGKFAANLI